MRAQEPEVAWDGVLTGCVVGGGAAGVRTGDGCGAVLPTPSSLPMGGLRCPPLTGAWRPSKRRNDGTLAMWDGRARTAPPGCVPSPPRAAAACPTTHGGGVPPRRRPPHCRLPSLPPPSPLSPLLSPSRPSLSRSWGATCALTCGQQHNREGEDCGAPRSVSPPAIASRFGA